MMEINDTDELLDKTNEEEDMAQEVKNHNFN